VPLQDNEEFVGWLKARQVRSRRLHGDPADPTKCSGCGLTANEQTVIDGECIECLARNFGIYRAESRIARIIVAVYDVIATRGVRGGCLLVQHLTDRMEDVISDINAEVSP
jgi:hypothetical protein